MNRTIVSIAFVLVGCAQRCGDGPGPATNTPLKSGGAADLVQLAVGNRWTYELKTTDSGQACQAGARTIILSQAEVFEGRAGFAQTPLCAGGSTHIAYNGEAVEEYDERAGAWIVSLDSPLEEGHSWTAKDKPGYQWRHIGWVKVPAGTFPDCWERLERSTNPDEEPSAIFCKGIGMVSENTREYAAQLTDFSLRGDAMAASADPTKASTAPAPSIDLTADTRPPNRPRP